MCLISHKDRWIGNRLMSIYTIPYKILKHVRCRSEYICDAVMDMLLEIGALIVIEEYTNKKLGYIHNIEYVRNQCDLSIPN